MKNLIILFFLASACFLAQSINDGLDRSTYLNGYSGIGTKVQVNTYAQLQSSVNNAVSGLTIEIENDLDTLTNQQTVIGGTTNITIQGMNSNNYCYIAVDSGAYNYSVFQVEDSANVIFKWLELDGCEFVPTRFGGAYNNWTAINVGYSTTYPEARAIVRQCSVYKWVYGLTVSGLNAYMEVDECVIRLDSLNGLGYGVTVSKGGKAWVHHSVFDTCRHHIASDGWVDSLSMTGSSYIAEYNEFKAGFNAGTILDMHGMSGLDAGSQIYGVGGDTMIVRYNRFSNQNHIAIGTRGKPLSGCWVYGNTFDHDWTFSTGKYPTFVQPIVPPTRAQQQSVATLAHHGNLFWWNNVFGVDTTATLPYFYNVYENAFSIQYDSGWVNRGAVGDAITVTEDSSIIATEFVFGDFDGDNTTDLISIWNVSSVENKSGAGRGTDSTGHLFVSFAGGLSEWYKINDSSYAIADLDVADVDGDGKSDLIYNESTYSSGGTGSWTALPQAFNTYTLYTKRDFNGDGIDDNYRISSD